MAITFPTVFQSAITTDPAATAAGYLTPTRYNQGCSIAGLSSTSGALLYSTDATTLAQDGTNLLYDATNKRLQVGTGNAGSAGVFIGHGDASGQFAIWNTALSGSLDFHHSALRQDSSGNTILGNDQGGNTTVNGKSNVTINGQSGVAVVVCPASAAGSGASIIAGTATTDVQALSVTQAWNAGGVSFTAVKLVATDTASAAGSLLMDLQTAGGGTQFSVRKDGLLSTGGTAVVSSFGPSAVTSITVKNGLITAIS